MMYGNLFAIAVKVGGKILRESSETVTLPFGSEYSILLKNINSVRVQAKVTVNGTDAADGWIVVAPNSSLDFERFVSNGNFNSGNRFKFIERTAEIEAHRGIDSDDGLVRVEYKFEVTRPAVRYCDVPIPRPCPYHRPPVRKLMHSARSMGPQASAGISQQRRFNDAGITVAGSKSNQKFVAVGWFETEAQSYVLVLKLRGVIAGKQVQFPITVDHKPQCSTCGKTNKAGNQFCCGCGASLILF
jgi:hypothetical protein